MQTPEFTRLAQSAAGMESQVRLGIDTVALSKSLIEVDQFDPRSGPMLTSLTGAEAKKRFSQYDRPRDLDEYRKASREFAKGGMSRTEAGLTPELEQQNFQNKLENIAYQYAATNPPEYIEGENRTLTVIRHYLNNASNAGSSARMALSLLGDASAEEYMRKGMAFVQQVEQGLAAVASE